VFLGLILCRILCVCLTIGLAYGHLEVRGCLIKGNFFSVLILRKMNKRRTIREDRKKSESKEERWRKKGKNLEKRKQKWRKEQREFTLGCFFMV
jgi:hypothetical protein